jgi:hypothetical protein
LASTIEDKRAAVSIRVGLSSSLSSAALAILGAQAALTTFILDKREHLIWFFIWSIVAWVSLVFSIYIGGKGIAEEYKAGYQGKWQDKSKKGQFKLQTLSALFGVISVLFLTICGDSKPDKDTKDDAKHHQDIAALTAQLSILQNNVDKKLVLENEITELKSLVNLLEKRSEVDQVSIKLLHDEVLNLSNSISCIQTTSKNKLKSTKALHH